MTLVTSDWLTYSPTGAQMTRQPSYEEWEHEVQMWMNVQELSPIVIGDLLYWGEIWFPDRYAQAIPLAVSGKRPQTLANYKSVMGSTPVEIRQEGLEYGHYEAVQGLSIQDKKEVLARAAAEGWGKEEARNAAREKKGLPAVKKSFRFRCKKVRGEVFGDGFQYVMENPYPETEEGDIPDGEANVTASDALL